MAVTLERFASPEIHHVIKVLTYRTTIQVAETLLTLRHLYDSERDSHPSILAEQQQAHSAALHKKEHNIPDHKNVYNTASEKGLEQGCKFDRARRITVYGKREESTCKFGCVLKEHLSLSIILNRQRYNSRPHDGFWLHSSQRADRIPYQRG